MMGNFWDQMRTVVGLLYMENAMVCLGMGLAWKHLKVQFDSHLKFSFSCAGGY